jgi:hypothetical protein
MLKIFLKNIFNIIKKHLKKNNYNNSKHRIVAVAVALAFWHKKNLGFQIPTATFGCVLS